MPSERRLHPLSFVFVIGGQIRQLVVPDSSYSSGRDRPGSTGRAG